MPTPSSQSNTIAIVVNYNAGEWLKRCLESINGVSEISHTYIIDNRSTDLSLDFIQPILDSDSEKFSLIENQKNLGFAKANNQILSKITNGTIECDYVLLINPDCEINPSVLPELYQQFDKQTGFGMLGCLIKNEDGSIQATCRRNFPTPKSALLKLFLLDKFLASPESKPNIGGDIPDDFVETQALSGAFMLVKKQALLDVGLLDEAYFMHCEDLDWCMRFRQANWKIGFTPNASIIHAKGVSSKSRPIGVLWTLHKGMSRFFDKFYADQYSTGFRWFVKFGIYASFLLRAGFASLKTIVFQGKGKTAALPKRYR